MDLKGTIEEVMDWDDQASHPMSSTACWVSPQSIVRGYCVHHPRPGAGREFIERRDLGATEPTWKVAVDAPATDIVSAGDLVMFSRMNGTVGILGLTRVMAPSTYVPRFGQT